MLGKDQKTLRTSLVEVAATPTIFAVRPGIGPATREEH
jgi:hypothetical protein